MKEKMYNLYAGLGGGFGGAQLVATAMYTSAEEADQDAYTYAIEEYQSYEGCHGILSYEEVREDIRNSFGDKFADDEDYVNNTYIEEMESWITWYAVEVAKDPNFNS